MYHFLNSENILSLPETSVFRIENHAFDTKAFLARMKSSYSAYKNFLNDRTEFDHQVDAFEWFADRLYSEDEAEFFFGVRLYEFIRHPDFDERRRLLWSQTVNPFLFAGDLNANMEDFNRYMRARVFLLPPTLMRIDHHYPFLALMENGYYRGVIDQVLHNRLESTQLSKTLFGHDVLSVFRKNIPLMKLIDLLDAGYKNKNADDLYFLCRRLFFHVIIDTFPEFKEQSFERVWSNTRTPAIQMLKGGFIDLLTAAFKLAGVASDKLEAFIKTSVKLFFVFLNKDTREAYWHMTEALETGFLFGVLGNNAKHRLKADRSFSSFGL